MGIFIFENNALVVNNLACTSFCKVRYVINIFVYKITPHCVTVGNPPTLRGRNAVLYAFRRILKIVPALNVMLLCFCSSRMYMYTHAHAHTEEARVLTHLLKILYIHVYSRRNSLTILWSFRFTFKFQSTYQSRYIL